MTGLPPTFTVVMALLALAFVVDLWTTFRFLRHGIPEANKWMRGILERHGKLAFAAVKLGGGAIVCPVVWLVGRWAAASDLWPALLGLHTMMAVLLGCYLKTCWRNYTLVTR